MSLRQKRPFRCRSLWKCISLEEEENTAHTFSALASPIPRHLLTRVVVLVLASV